MAVKNDSGMWMDGKGDYIPPRYIQKLDRVRDQVVTKLANKAIKLNAQMAKLKQEVFNEVARYVDEAKEFYNVNIDTEEGNKTLTDFANLTKLEVRVRKQLAFDEKLEFAKSLIDKCIARWSAGANDKLILLVEQAFKTDSKGMIDRDKILGLRKLKIKDSEWEKAMKIIGDSLTVVNKKAYISFQRKENGKWTTIYLDIAKI